MSLNEGKCQLKREKKKPSIYYRSYLFVCPGFFETESSLQVFQTSSPSHPHNRPETDNIHAIKHRNILQTYSKNGDICVRRVTTHGQQCSLAVATDGPDWSSIGLHGILGPQLFQIILSDFSIQASAEQTLTHPAESLNSPAVSSWDHLCSRGCTSSVAIPAHPISSA